MSAQSKTSGAQPPVTPFTRRKRSVQKARGVNTTDRNFKPTLGGKGKNSWTRGGAGIPTGWLTVSLPVIGHMMEHSVQNMIPVRIFLSPFQMVVRDSGTHTNTYFAYTYFIWLKTWPRGL